MCGILTAPVASRDVGVVIVVGGPQYRVGSHRQFVLLARSLAQEGIASLRFDFRGMGDSEGDMRSFEAVDDDVEAAANALLASVPELRGLVLWGLCDGASAALIAAARMPRLMGVVALNPWVRSEASFDRTLVRHYYRQRLFAPEFWKKLLTGRLALRRSMGEFLRRAASRRTHPETPDGVSADAPFQQRMLAGLRRLDGRVLVILSGRDLTAREFVTYCAGDPEWKAVLGDKRRIEVRQLPEADHTFSSATARADCERASIDFALRCRGDLDSA
jgi:exosortase A-associated hydrolase 1